MGGGSMCVVHLCGKVVVVNMGASHAGMGCWIMPAWTVRGDMAGALFQEQASQHVLLLRAASQHVRSCCM